MIWQERARYCRRVVKHRYTRFVDTSCSSSSDNSIVLSNRGSKRDPCLLCERVLLGRVVARKWRWKRWGTPVAQQHRSLGSSSQSHTPFLPSKFDLCHGGLQLESMSDTGKKFEALPKDLKIADVENAITANRWSVHKLPSRRSRR